jgi:hypothetical protein
MLLLLLHSPFVDAARWAKTASLAEEAVAADEDGRIAAGCTALGRGHGARKVPPNHGIRHNDRLTAEHDVLGPDQGGLAVDLVARILREKSQMSESMVIWEATRLSSKLTVSIHSPFGALLDILTDCPREGAVHGWLGISMFGGSCG